MLLRKGFVKMSFRTVVVTKQCKCSYKNGYLVVRDEDTKLIHLSEIYCLVLDTTAVSVTAYLINELMKRKIQIIICDEQHNPSGEVLPIYGSHNTSKKVTEQIAWTENAKQSVWTVIVSEKIRKQAEHLKSVNNENSQKLFDYLSEIEFNDITNREGHAAKVYFNSLFGKSFSRDDENDINAALDYGYAVLLSSFNKEIVSNGFLTQLGICHKNEFNQFNLACDMMEPFRPIVDRYVKSKVPFVFNEEIRYDLLNLLNLTLKYDDSEYFLTSVISLYVKNVFNAISSENFENIKFYEVL